MYIGNTDCRVNMLLNDNVLQLVSDVKDLGVTVDAHLTFNKHIDQVVARAFIRSNLIHKCFASREVPNFVTCDVGLRPTCFRICFLCMVTVSRRAN